MPSGHSPVTVSYVVLGMILLKVLLDSWPHVASYMSIILDGWNVLGDVKSGLWECVDNLEIFGIFSYD